MLSCRSEKKRQNKEKEEVDDIHTTVKLTLFLQLASHCAAPVSYPLVR